MVKYVIFFLVSFTILTPNQRDKLTLKPAMPFKQTLNRCEFKKIPQTKVKFWLEIKICPVIHRKPTRRHHWWQYNLRLFTKLLNFQRSIVIYFNIFLKNCLTQKGWTLLIEILWMPLWKVLTTEVQLINQNIALSAIWNISAGLF